MNAILCKMMSAFAFSSARRRYWRARAKISKLSENNEIDKFIIEGTLSDEEEAL